MPLRFEIGSSAFFRSSSHQTLVDHLDITDSLDGGQIQDAPVHTLSASMFLPRQSVWNFRRDLRRRASPPDPTPGPRSHASQRKSSHLFNKQHAEKMRQRRSDLERMMRPQFALWNHISEEFCKQGSGPGLMSGNTVIDERNFAMM